MHHRQRTYFLAQSKGKCAPNHGKRWVVTTTDWQKGGGVELLLTEPPRPEGMFNRVCFALGRQLLLKYLLLL